MITVLGAKGFIGSHLVAHLARSGAAFRAPGRNESLEGTELGHIIDCVGLTSDFRSRPWDAVEAHVGRLLEIVRTCAFDSILYLSSTRLYRLNAGPARESDPLGFEPEEPEDLYGLSKATGEAMILSLGAKGRVARLANVYGAGQKDTFLASLIAEARTCGVIRLRTARDSEKDYVSVEDVVDLLVKIALGGRHRVYNVASGVQVSNTRIVEALAATTGCRIEVAPAAPRIFFPPIDIGRISEEFGFAPRDLFAALPGLAAGA